MSSDNYSQKYLTQCRACFNENSNEMITIESLQTASNMVSLLTYLNIEVIEGFPNELCKDCVTVLHYILNFKNQCVTTLTLIKNTVLKAENDLIENPESKLVIKLEEIKEEELKVDVCHSNNEDDNYLDNDYEMDQSLQELKLEINKNNAENVTNENSDRKKYQCTVCLKKFINCDILAQHLVKKHNFEKKVYLCPLCPKKYFTKQHLDNHLPNHNNVTCHICNKTFNNKKYLKRHKLRHALDRAKFYCEECKKFYASVDSYDGHRRRFHSNNPVPKTVCAICGTSVYNIKHHMNRKHTVGNIKCKYCEKILKNQESLKCHVKLMHENKEMNSTLCSICGKVYRDLALHNRMKHSNERKYKCQYCEKTYKTSSHQRKHERIAHLKERPFKCNYCERAFGTKGILENHIHTHTGERPYACDVCKKAFAQKVTLNTHIKLVHGSKIK